MNEIKGTYNHPDGYRYVWLGDSRIIGEHRYVMEKHLKRRLKYNEIVHHKDGNKLNNSIDNLEVISRKSHPSKHKKGRRMVDIICKFCGKVSSKEARQVEPKIKKGQIDFYCDRICMAKDFGFRRSKK